MLSYDDALARILNAIPGPLDPESVFLADAWGRALAADVFADVDLPPFDNSAVDGFAVRLADCAEASSSAPVRLRVTQTIAAGYAPVQAVGMGEAARILTGAPLPPGADAVIMVEDTNQTAEDTVWLMCPPSPRFIRRVGSDLPKGTLALATGATIDAGTIGLLAALNHTEAACSRRPRVALLTTGDEIVAVGGSPLAPSQIRDANGPALVAAIVEAGALVAARLHVPDDPDATRNALRAAASCDLVVSCGGVSVGDFDFVKAAIEAEGRLDFWRVAIKPGKPLCFGRVGNALFFGLPGNPASSLVTFELFVRPLLRKMAGHRNVLRRYIEATLSEYLEHEPGRREFVRARLDPDNRATPTGAQTSHRLLSLVGADALLIADENRGDYAAGETLPALLLG